MGHEKNMVLSTLCLSGVRLPEDLMADRRYLLRGATTQRNEHSASSGYSYKLAFDRTIIHKRNCSAWCVQLEWFLRSYGRVTVMSLAHVRPLFLCISL